MKIGNFEFTFGRAGSPVNVDKKAAEQSQVLTKLIRTQLFRSRSEIKDWTNATLSAEQIQHPSRTELIRIYNNIVIDSHLSAVMMTLKLKVVGLPWKIFTGSEVDEQATQRLTSVWFRSVLEGFIDAEFYGFTLIQLGDIVKDRFEFEFVPREYVVPEKRSIKKTLTSRSDDELISVDADPYGDWLILCDSGTLGLLHKAAPLVIMKKNVLSAWSEYAEIFGMPIRVGRTDIRDPAKYKNMDKMLAEMGSAAYGIFDPSDTLEFIETSKGDAFNVFNEFIARIDQQISKLFLGQTGTTDEKAFAGSSNVHSAILDDIVAALSQKMTFFVNDVVAPKMIKHGIMKAGQTFGIQQENRLTNDEKMKALDVLLKYYVIDPEFIEKEFGVPVFEKPIAPPAVIPTGAAANPESVMKVVAKLYADAIHHDHQH